MFFKKKEQNTDLLSGAKPTKPEKEMKEKKRTASKPLKAESKEPEKKVAQKKAPVAKKRTTQGHSLLKPIKENFASFNDVPKNAEIISETEKGDFFVEDHLRKDILLLKAVYSPQNIGENIPCVIMIATKKEMGSVNWNQFRLKAKEKREYFVVCIKDDATSFIESLKTTLYSNNTHSNKELSSSQKLVTNLFKDAVEAGVSDLHIEVGGDITQLRARINGEINLFDSKTLGSNSTSEEQGYIFARTIYNSMATVSGLSFNEKETQDALVVIKHEDLNLRVRVATAPTEPEGFDMVMRLLVIQDSTKPLTLEQLGYQKKQRDMIEEAVAQGTGATIIAGTTGSGKSTTLQNVLMVEINNRNGNLKVITVEDPPEYFIPGASQIPVIKDKDGSAATASKKAIKASMRMDPDVIMIGEVRDEVSAKLLIEAVQTGHKVLSTIHASSALSIVSRLENLGIERDVLGDTEFISGLLYQKLFPVICPHCSIPLKDGFIPSKKPIEKVLIEKSFTNEETIKKTKLNYPKVPLVRALQDSLVLNVKQAEEVLKHFENENNEEENEKLLKRITSIAGNINEHNIHFKGDGCEHCKKGVIGRTVVSEVVRPDMNLRELISAGKYTEIFKYWRKNLGGKTAEEDAYQKMLAGKLSPIDIEETFGFIKPPSF